MRYIGHADSNATPIFEGDVLEITNPEDFSHFDEDFIKDLGITRITLEVLDLKGAVGVDIKVLFYIGDRQLLNSETYDYYMSQSESDDEKQGVKDHFSDSDMSDPLSFTYNHLYDDSFLYHGFIHRKSKTIIDSKVPLDERKELVSKQMVSELNLNLHGKTYCAFRTEFLVEITPEAKERIFEAHNSLYSPARYEGDFTHLLLKPKKVSFCEYELSCSPVDKDGNKTLYEVNHSWEKYKELSLPIELKWSERIQEWKESNKHLSDSEIAKHSKEMWNAAKKEFQPLEKSKETEVSTLMDTIFLGLMSGENLFHFFDQTNCKVTAIEK